MTGDEILQRWHLAKVAHSRASPSEYGHTLYARMAAEAQAIDHFGLGPHYIAYERRYGSQESQTSETPA